MRTSSSASLPGLAEAEVSDDEEDTVARDAAATTSRSRIVRKQFSQWTGRSGYFSGKKKAPDALLGGMPPAADACGKCGERPGDLTCCACGASICASCSTLTGDALVRAAQFEKKKGRGLRKKDALTLYVCDGCGGGLSSTRCAECPLRAGNEPLADVVVRKLHGAGHHHASLNCENGPIFQSKSPPCTKGTECINCFDKETGNRIADGRPLGDATTAKAARKLKEDFPLAQGLVLVEKDSDRRATVVEGNGLEATVIYQGSDQPQVVAPYQVFSTYVDGTEEEDCGWPDSRCRLCRSDVGNRARDAQFRTARALMDVERAQTGVQGIVRDPSTFRDWLAANPNDPQGRSDQKILADAYANIEAASLPQEDDAVTGRQVCFRVRHTSRCPPVAW